MTQLLAHIALKLLDIKVMMFEILGILLAGGAGATGMISITHSLTIIGIIFATMFTVLTTFHFRHVNNTETSITNLWRAQHNQAEKFNGIISDLKDKNVKKNEIEINTMKWSLNAINESLKRIEQVQKIQGDGLIANKELKEDIMKKLEAIANK